MKYTSNTMVNQVLKSLDNMRSLSNTYTLAKAYNKCQKIKFWF